VLSSRHPEQEGPLPSERGWVTIGLFVLSTLVVALLAINPALANVQLFATIATLVIGAGGLLAAVSYYLGSSKSSADKDAAISKQLDKAPPP
jgi:hypothetical protein